MKFYTKIWFWAVVLIVSIAAYGGYRKLSASIEIKTLPIARQDLDFTVSATSSGTLKAETEIKVTAERTGKVEKLYVEEGDSVKAGGQIADLDAEEVSLALRLARASHDRSSSSLAEMRSSLDALRAEVESGIRASAARSAEAGMKYAGIKDLFDKGYVSEIDLVVARTAYEVAGGDLEAAQARRESVAAQEERIKAQEAAVREARQELALRELDHRRSFIRSSIDGIVTARPVKQGDTVTIGTEIASVISPDSLYIEGFIDEADLERVTLGREVKVQMDAFADRTLTGRIYKISPVVLGGRQETRTFEVRVSLDNADMPVKAGMSADLEVVVDRVRDALVVPSQAVVSHEGEKAVYVVEDGRAVLKSVEAGISDWTSTQITNGLSEGQTVVTTPDVVGLKDGARVRSKDMRD